MKCKGVGAVGSARGLAGGLEADDHVARLDVGVVDHVLALHPARHLHEDEMTQMSTR